MVQEIDNLDELKSLLEAQMRELGKRLEASIINKETKKGLKECKASKGLKECKATPAIDRQKTLPEIPVSAKGSSECEKNKGFLMAISYNDCRREPNQPCTGQSCTGQNWISFGVCKG